MLRLSCNWVIALIVVFLIFLFRAYRIDQTRLAQHAVEQQRCSSCQSIAHLDTRTPEGFHAAVVATMQNEHRHGLWSGSQVHRLLTNSRDQIVRGLIMGAIGGSAAEALHSAVTWSLVSGIVTGCSDLMSWRRTRAPMFDLKPEP